MQWCSDQAVGDQADLLLFFKQWRKVNSGELKKQSRQQLGGAASTGRRGDDSATMVKELEVK